MPRFFIAGTNLLGGTAIIRGRDAEHVRVLRLKPGEDMIICDGQGTDYKCRLVSADKEQVEHELDEKYDTLREEYKQEQAQIVSLEEARKKKPKYEE